MSAYYIETRALFGRFFRRKVVHRIPDFEYAEFDVRTPDPNYRGSWTRGEMSFVIFSTPRETHYQILRDNTHVTLTDDGIREHLIFNNCPDFVVRHTL